ncbi:trypsin-like peptidase domain-containing protein [Plasticicumulans acidivorans]|uniref:Probable periplasmic serine endoprotease DegP-like n=1 Tax=Plasticicumulans acidivorans TaxID=886464 RepID=A0A317N255_9GAMM|nr:trypsin-like peptidase domain-containing protein [Plasticicumulans acidivorans]PWV63373.1 serine protease Do [Plasticicumulans acidivorans]
MIARGGALAAWLMFGCAFMASAAGLPDFPSVVKRNSGAVVNISTSGGSSEQAATSRQDSSDDEEGQGADESLGTGLLISEDGFILTNQHVVADAEEILVRLSDRRELPARVVGSDERTDLALLKIDADHLPVATLGRAKDLEVGEWVLAIGSPFGFEQSVTAGIVSAKGRSLPTEPYVSYIQTDVPINPGNSGGPLINLHGEVVGINSQIYSQTGGYMGLSFAIPIETAIDVVEQLRRNGRVSRGWLGVQVQPLTRDLAEAFGVATPRGALVSKVFAQSPAAVAGVRVGDVITRFDGHDVELSTALPPMVGATVVGSDIALTLLRERREKQVQVRITELRDQDATGDTEQAPPAPQRPLNRIGLRLAPVPDELRQLLDVASGGALIESLENGVGARGGLRQGDLLTMFNGSPITSPDVLDHLLAALPAGSAFALLVQRRSGPAYLALRAP